MNFTEVVNEVISITKRPDKVADIRRNVNQAISFFCVETSFARDRDEVTVTLDSTLYAQSIALTEFTRFRKIEAVVVPYRAKPLDHVAPDKLFTKGGCDVTDAWYIAGDNLHLKLSTLAESANFSYFKYPPVLTGTETFWLLDMSPYMVIDRAAAIIFANIGDDVSARHHKSLADEAFLSAQRDYKHSSHYG